MTTMRPRVAIVGAGPAGAFAAASLLRARGDAEIDLFERLPTPWGLLRGGVATDAFGKVPGATVAVTGDTAGSMDFNKRLDESLPLVFGFVLGLVNSFKRNISPGLVLAFAALEGVALGAISKIFNIAYPGVVATEIRRSNSG